MKRSDLYGEYARVIDMCESAGVPVKGCVKLRWQIVDLDIKPRFDDLPSDYVFAVAILEGAPLFVGDEVYWKKDGNKLDWDLGKLSSNEAYQKYLTRTPKRTITLNGERLPAPEGKNTYWYPFDFPKTLTRPMSEHGVTTKHPLLIRGSGDNVYYYKNSEDLTKVEDAINNLLSGK